MVMPRPPRFSVAPTATLTGPLPSEPTSTMVIWPALMVVPPVKVLAPLRVRIPDVALISDPLPARLPAKVPSLTVRAVEAARVIVPAVSVPTVAAAPLRLNVPSVSVPMEPEAPLKVNVPVVSVAMEATPPIEVVPPLTVVTVAAPVIVLVPPVTEAEEREPRAFVPAVISPESWPVTVTELLTLPIIEPAVTVPAVTLPVSAPVTVTAPPVTLPVREPAVTVPPVMLAPRAPTTVTLPSETPAVMSASLPKRVRPEPASEAKMILPVEAVKLRAAAAVPALVTAPVMFRSAAEIVAVAEASSASVAARL